MAHALGTDCLATCRLDRQVSAAPIVQKNERPNVSHGNAKVSVICTKSASKWWIFEVFSDVSTRLLADPRADVGVLRIASTGRHRGTTLGSRRAIVLQHFYELATFIPLDTGIQKCMNLMSGRELVKSPPQTRGTALCVACVPTVNFMHFAEVVAFYSGVLGPVIEYLLSYPQPATVGAA